VAFVLISPERLLGRLVAPIDHTSAGVERENSSGKNIDLNGFVTRTNAQSSA